jgi:hypothetical protein
MEGSLTSKLLEVATINVESFETSQVLHFDHQKSIKGSKVLSVCRLLF